MGARIEVAGLTKTYGDLTAVDDLSLTVEPGEFFGLLGPNGAGKTTALEMIEGLRRPDAGTVSIDGHDPWKRDPELQRRLGVQLQSSAFFERLTAREQLATFAALYGAPPARVDQLLAQVGLEDKADARVEKLSGGQAQRLSIACALVHDPEVVFLDEPSAALDPQARRKLWDFLEGLNESGRTVVLTTHYMEEAEFLCDRVAIIDRGRLLKLDSPAALVRGLDAPTRISLAPEAIDEAGARGIDGVEEVTVHPDRTVLTTRRPAEVLAELARHDALHGLTASGATLEDVFLELTGREYRS
ncbi:multidrug ABC transporter ATP-binding protein [Aeromicrobium flavum]|uniref:Multidrug ABC transporter ATP-binding protein n=1 Tax=Aeromicrobium flavum TaxID=416568 RepID=A0A512HSL7_9ACTN|nr:ABC transporter ATP-binding protein [Aeromicrobium flavum]GEO88437.1 multidrug ABC transporter ATP-binding protein [Aeromicrobium flavum]